MGKRKSRFVKGSPEALEWGRKLAEAKKIKNASIKAGDTTVQTENTVTITKAGDTAVSDITEPVSREMELTKELQDGMPTKVEYTMYKPGLAKKHNDWNEKNKERIQEWKEIRRSLYPDDHNAANLENIRPTGVIEVK